MQAVWVTINQWNSFVSLCTRVGVPRPAYAGVSHPKTGEMGYLIDKTDWDTIFIEVGVNPYRD